MNSDYMHFSEFYLNHVLKTNYKMNYLSFFYISRLHQFYSLEIQYSIQDAIMDRNSQTHYSRRLFDMPVFTSLTHKNIFKVIKYQLTNFQTHMK